MNSTTHKHMGWVLLLIILGMGLMACAAPTAEVATGNTAVTSRGITVIGQGEAMGQPTQANIAVGVEISAATVREATNQNEAIVAEIMAALAAQGIDEKDIQTSNYNVWAEQIYGEQGPQGISGYRVTNMVNITIRDINQVGAVLQATTEAGANAVHGVYFSVADTAALEAEARTAAITNARARAQSLAELAGVELGEVLMITEVIGSNYPLPMGSGRFDTAMSESAAPSISPGQLSFTTQIQVTFAIK
jgi:uncharacterized protein